MLKDIGMTVAKKVTRCSKQAKKDKVYYEGKREDGHGALIRCITP